MSDDYPREEELDRLAKWDFFKDSVEDFIDEIEDLWHWPDWGFIRTGKRIIKLQLHTGGWSGNESIIEAIEKNFIFWTMAWVKTQRGGHYWFEIILKNFSHRRRPEIEGRGR